VTEKATDSWAKRVGGSIKVGHSMFDLARLANHLAAARSTSSCLELASLAQATLLTMQSGQPNHRSMTQERQNSRAWVLWAIGIGLLLVAISMFLLGRPGAMSDRPDFYLSSDGVAYALSPFVAMTGLLWLAVLGLRSGR
jgi:hypothetical protein